VTAAVIQQQRPVAQQAAPVSWWDTFQQNRAMPQPRQVQSWTCSICSTDWVLRATDLDPNSTREKVTGEIGYPSCVDENLGLKDTQCVVRVFESYGVQAKQEWIDWARALELCGSTTGVLNSTIWQHFVAIRGVTDDGQLWIANSASGYDGIYETISREQWDAWSGSWQTVTLVR
jgi:hypothetical protein